MMQVLDRDYKQSFSEIEHEFEFCHVLVKLDNVMDEEGYLIAISEEPGTHREMCDYSSKYPAGTLFYIGGHYKNGSAIGLQNIVGE